MTEREARIARLRAVGLTFKQIAAEIEPNCTCPDHGPTHKGTSTSIIAQTFRLLDFRLAQRARLERERSADELP